MQVIEAPSPPPPMEHIVYQQAPQPPPEIRERVVEVEKIVEIPVDRIVEVPVDKCVPLAVSSFDGDQRREILLRLFFLSSAASLRAHALMAFCPCRIVDRYVEVPIEKVVQRFREVCTLWSICCGLWLGTKRGSSCYMPRISLGSVTQQYRVRGKIERV